MIVRALALLLVSLAALGCSDSLEMSPETRNAPLTGKYYAEPLIGAHDESFINLPRPLNIADAKRVLVEATVFAPWGIGYGGRPIQALAINTILERASAQEILEQVYQEAKLPGQLLAMCGLQTASPKKFKDYADRLLFRKEQVVTYSGCFAETQPVVEFISLMVNTPICLDIPKSRERIIARCDRAADKQGYSE